MKRHSVHFSNALKCVFICVIKTYFASPCAYTVLNTAVRHVAAAGRSEPFVTGILASDVSLEANVPGLGWACVLTVAACLDFLKCSWDVGKGPCRKVSCLPRDASVAILSDHFTILCGRADVGTIG